MAGLPSKKSRTKQTSCPLLYWNAKAKSLCVLLLAENNLFMRGNFVDITHALLNAGFNDTVTIVISLIWEMLELGARSWVWIFQMQFTRHSRAPSTVHWFGSSWEQSLDWLPANWPNASAQNLWALNFYSWKNLWWAPKRGLQELYIFDFDCRVGVSLCLLFSLLKKRS